MGLTLVISGYFGLFLSDSCMPVRTDLNDSLSSLVFSYKLAMNSLCFNCTSFVEALYICGRSLARKLDQFKQWISRSLTYFNVAELRSLN
jgi:hypothetical protein